MLDFSSTKRARCAVTLAKPFSNAIRVPYRRTTICRTRQCSEAVASFKMFETYTADIMLCHLLLEAVEKLITVIASCE